MGGARDIEDRRVAMTLASICWNLPVFERTKKPEYFELQEQFDAALAQSEEPVPSILRQLAEDRKTKFASIPFYVVVEVRGTSLDDCVVYAEARGDAGPTKM